jgi:uncharacterized DUF497 family protein
MARRRGRRRRAFTTIFDWAGPDDPSGNVAHIAEHAVTPEGVEEVFADPRVEHTTSRNEDRGFGLPAVLGRTRNGRYLFVAYTRDEEPEIGVEVIKVVTAYEAPDP